MGRAGRKPNPLAKRRQTTREGQGRDRPPVDMLRHRVEALGICALGPDNVLAMAKRLGLMSMATDYPLDVLALLGKLGEDGHIRASAGARFAELYCRVYGSSSAPAAALGYRAPEHEADGKRSLMTEAERAESDAQRLRRMFRAMGGRPDEAHVAAVVVRVAVHCHPPRPAHMPALIRGLDALCGVT